MVRWRLWAQRVICPVVLLAWMVPGFAAPPTSAPSSGELMAAPSAVSGPAKTHRIADIRLDAEGRLNGLLVDGDGVPLGRRELTLRRLQPKAVPVRVMTDDQGRFASGRLSGGLYEVRIDRLGQVVRLWEKEAAPPKARSALLVVAGDLTVRGQRRVGELLSSDTVVIGGLVAAAVAIPLAVSGSDDGPVSP